MTDHLTNQLEGVVFPLNLVFGSHELSRACRGLSLDMMTIALFFFVSNKWL